MGGRGRDSGLKARQITIKDVELQNKIADILQKSKARRGELMGSGTGVGGTSSSALLKKCACCGEYTIPVTSEYETCPICGWIDDDYQNKHPDSLQGKNPVSLVDAKAEYRKKQQK